MCGTGLTLQAEDFSRIPPSLVAFGVACQFLVMPLAAFTVASAWLKPYPDLFLGLCLVGCSPGGTASNLVSLIANADVALSVVLTACSTLLAVVVTPALVQLLTRSTVSGAIRISGVALVQATAKVVFAPVLLGMLLKAKAPRAADSISRFTPFCSAVLVALICGGVVAQNTVELRAGPAASLLPDVVRSVLALHGLGFALGYVLPARLLRRRQGGGAAELQRTARTVSIEVGMQNSALAVVLARSITSNPAAALPGALSATAHSCLGSLLAAVWRSQDERDRNKRVRPGKGARAETFPEIRPSYGEDDPEFAI
jgi:BASS family bile acid:Na+ symporter